MSKVEDISIQDLKKWLASLDTLDLIEVETLVLEARERKKNEGRVSLIRVVADGINVAWFRGGDIKGVLSYLASHADKLSSLDGMVRTDMIRVPESEVEGRLADRWW